MLNYPPVKIFLYCDFCLLPLVLSLQGKSCFFSSIVFHQVAEDSKRYLSLAAFFSRLNKLSSLSLSLPIMSSNLDHLGDPSLDLLQYINIFLCTWEPKTILEVWCHKWQIEENSLFPWHAGYTFTKTVWDVLHGHTAGFQSTTCSPRSPAPFLQNCYLTS